jgi:hypothetical protein
MQLPMPRAFILGLQDDFRGQRLEEQLHELGIETSRIPGIDGRRLDKSELTKLYSKRASRLLLGRDMSSAEVACVIGHRRMMMALVASGAKYAFFFEDDAAIESDLRPLLSILSFISGQRAVVLLGSSNHVDPSDEARPRYGWNGGVIAQLQAPGTGAFAYLMTREAAQFALARYHGRKVDSVADWPLGWSHDVTFWRSEPPLAKHTSQADRLSLIAAGREVAVHSRPLQNPSWPQIQLSRLTRFSGLGIVLGLTAGVPARDSFRATIGEPLRRRLSETSQRRGDQFA